MEEFEKKIIGIFEKKINTPLEYKNAINTAFETTRNQPNFFKTIITTALGVLMTTGIVFAGYTVYEKIWKEPIKYDVFQEKPPIISKEEKEKAVSEEKIKEDATKLLNILGYSDKKVQRIELFRSYDASTTNYYCVSTEDTYDNPEQKRNIGIYLNFNGETGKFEYFINNDFFEIKNKLEKIEKEKAIELAQNTLNSIGFTTERYKIKTCENVSGNEWNIVFSRSYNGIYNRFDEFQISFGAINNKIIVESINGLIDNNFENNDFIITKQEAIEIAKNKELEFSNEEIIDVTAKKSIEKMNGYIYCFEKNIEDTFSVKTENKIRNVWVVKVKHDDNKTDYSLSQIERQKKYMSKQYYVDATTGEIIGGEQGKFDLGID